MTRERPEWAQLDLSLDGASDCDGAWQLLLKLVRAEVDRRGLKEVAFELDMQPSQLSHCLNERERHNLSARALVHITKYAATDDISAFFAALRGLKVEPRKQMTPEEEVTRYRRWVAALPESMRRSIAAEVYGDDETARFRKR